MTIDTQDAGPAPGAQRPGDRSPTIFGIRGLAALALTTIHVAMFAGLLGTRAFGTPRPPTNAVGGFFVSGLPSFIGVFFVLPAMYIYLPIAKAIIAGHKRPPQRKAYVRRLLRLLPAYYFMFLIALFALNRGAITGFWFVLRPILLLQVYLPSPFTPKFINGMEVTWSVPSMVQWYALIPAIGWATHKFAARGATPAARARRLMLPVPFLITLGLGWLFFVKAMGWDNRIVFWWPQGFAPTIGIGMGLAVMLALAQVSRPDTPRLLRAVAARPNLFWLAALGAYLVNCARPFSVIGMDAIYSTTGLLITYLMVALFGLLAVLPLVVPGATTPLMRAVVGNRPIAYFGKVSYGVYLWHFSIMHFVLQPGSIFSRDIKPIRELYGTCGFWKLEILTLAGSVLMATVSLYLVEKPITAWGDRLLNGRGERGDGRERAKRRLAAQVSPADAPAAKAAMVAAAVAIREAVQANLLELERGISSQLLAGATLTGRTRQLREAAATDLAALLEIFAAYSAVVDRAVEIMAAGSTGSAAASSASASGSSADELTDLLTGPSIAVAGEPAPLGRRHITDDGRATLSIADAVDEMNVLFSRVAQIVAAAETVWTDVAREVGEIDADLAEAADRAAGRAEPDPDLTAAIAAGQAQSRRLRRLLDADPLALWEDGRVKDDELAALRRHAAEATARAALIETR